MEDDSYSETEYKRDMDKLSTCHIVNLKYDVLLGLLDAEQQRV